MALRVPDKKVIPETHVHTYSDIYVFISTEIYKMIRVSYREQLVSDERVNQICQSIFIIKSSR